uniref:Uncharacterized protein n=1 Tax=Avena sativa TaxID=4498 RepID=A0ACD5Z5I0_AVESA
MRNSPELLEEFKNNYLPPHLKAQLADEKSCRNLKSGRVGKGSLYFTAHAKGSLNDIQIKATNKRKGSEEPLLAEEDEEDKVEPLPDWITSRLEENLPPEVNPEAENFKRCTPSYYLLPHNCITLKASYRTKLGRSILNDTLVSPPSVESLHKTQSDYEKKVIICEDQMFESDMLLQRFRATADFIANLQNSVGSGLRISEHITPLHRRCIQKLYDDELEIDDLLESQNTSAALSILLSRLNQVVENLSEARLCLQKILPPVIAENYYRSLDHHGPSFKHLDSKRMGHKALLAEAKEIYKSRLNAGDEYANPDIHKDISRIISSVRSSEEKLMMTWAKIVHPFLSANCLRSYLEETVAPSEACEHCGINKHVLNSISVALVSSKLPLSPKEGDITTISGHPRTDTSVPSSCAHGNEPEKNNEPMKLSKQTTIPRGVKGGTCCSLVVLRRLYQILYSRLQSARDLCSGDLYTEFKEQLCRLLDRSIDNCKFEDFCLKFLGPNSFELFTLDILINRVIKQLFVISSSGLLVQLLQELLRRPILPKPLSPHQNVILQSLFYLSAIQPTSISALFTRPSTGLHDREEQDGKLPLHFERRKKRKLEDGALSYS